MCDGFSTLFAVNHPEQKRLLRFKKLPLEYLRQVTVLTYLSHTQEPVQQASSYVSIKSKDPTAVSREEISKKGEMT